MTDPLRWLRSEMEDARERAQRKVPSWSDSQAAIEALDRVGDALQKLPEEDWMIVYETISWHDDRGADLLFELLLKARRRE